MAFTSLPVGTILDGKEMQKCPYCQRNGLREEVEGKIYYAHGHTLSLRPNQELDVRFDYCPQPKKVP